MLTKGCGQYNGQGMYCDLGTGSGMFHMFTTQLYSCFCSYNATVFIYWREGSIATGILQTPNTSLSSLPVGSKSYQKPSLAIKEGRFQETSVQRQSATTLQCCHQVVGLGKQCPFWYDHSGFGGWGGGGGEMNFNIINMTWGWILQGKVFYMTAWSFFRYLGIFKTVPQSLPK